MTKPTAAAFLLFSLVALSSADDNGPFSDLPEARMTSGEKRDCYVKIIEEIPGWRRCADRLYRTDSAWRKEVDRRVSRKQRRKSAVIPTIPSLDTDSPPVFVPRSSPRLNSFGPGLHSDQFGRPFSYRDRHTGGRVFGPVKENAYGLGTHMDQYGRPVERDFGSWD